ncbi:hypothetical protein DFP72DRAFT_1013660 [Ephemerocybe angulata]|uniref:Uncharacterized protein n=1 Tax=Ephemerocybe angulata TaxID=980116 RepID=A0A8H6HMK2_9AGAR|nr:hypothetical protein DFP72DRAFT_1013660 [Tulosesus angulatus]
MEAVVPQEITSELTQILSNLVLGDNEIRANAEKAVSDRLARTPELYLLALAQFAIAADTEVVRRHQLLLFSSADCSFAPHPRSHTTTPRNHDYLSTPQTLTTLERLLLHSLSHKPLPSVRKKRVDTICDVAKQRMPAQLAQSLSLMHPILETIHTLSRSLSSPAPASDPAKSNHAHLTVPLRAHAALQHEPSVFPSYLPALLSLEAKPGMVRKVMGWVEGCVSACVWLRIPFTSFVGALKRTFSVFS